ncbi:MAG: hypothetical protein IJ071_05085 [Ruminococcus sp.]|nr:hypothetical protein [Ruminococcus sp.]
MELMIHTKGSKYTAIDKKERLLYTVKKKGFGAPRFLLLDASNYQLYSLLQTGEDRKPTFSLTHNDASFINMTCKSLFLDPTILAEGKDTVYQIASKDHRDFTVIKDGVPIGSIKTLLTVSGDLQYEVEIDDKFFDDYIILFAVAVDRTFGDMNKSK